MSVSTPSLPSTPLATAERGVADSLLAQLGAIDASQLKRELHDTVLQDVLYLAMELTRIEDVELTRAPDGTPPIGLAEVARDAYHHFREILGGASSAETTHRTLSQLVERQRDWFTNRTGRHLDVLWPDGVGDVPLSEGVSHNLCRIIHEALWNAWVHAEAEHIALAIEHSNEGLIITIADDGRGFAPDDIPESHYGLGNMVERAELIGAQLSVESTPGTGTTVRMALDSPISICRGGAR